MKCAQPPQRPLQWLHRHAYTHTHTLCNNTTQHVSRQHTHIHPNQWATTNEQTNQQTNQPTNQPNSAVPEPINQLPTNATTNQATRKPTANQPTSQVPVHTGGGGRSMTREEGGQSIPLTRTAQCITQMGGGGKGGGKVGSGDLYTRQTHTTETHGTKEGRSNTPTSWCHRVPTSSPQSKKSAHLQRGNGYPP